MRNTDSIGNIIHLHLYNTFHFRTPLIGVIVLCLCVFGTPLFTCTSGPTISEQNHVAPLPLKSTSTPVPSRGPTARTPSLVPTPQPISPLPLNVQQQVAVLEAHDRFFYHGNTSLPEIALTFDDGPNPPYTTQVLTILQRYGIHATFFCMGKHVQQYPDLVRQEYRQGNLVENHTWSHPSLLSLNESSITWQLLTTANIIEYVIGERPTLFRPPMVNLMPLY